MKPRDERIFVQTRLDAPTHGKLLRAAKKDGRSVADYVRRLITRYVDVTDKLRSVMPRGDVDI